MKAAASSISTAKPAIPGIQSWCLNDGDTSAYLTAVKAWSVNEQQGAQALARIDQWTQGDRKALLNLSGLLLTSLPPLHPDLRQLDASNNQLTALPEHLPQLQVLIVRANALTHLPEALPVSSLHKLDVANNQLNCMPSGLHWLRPGCEIHVHGNRNLGQLQAPIDCLLDMELFVLLNMGDGAKLSRLLKEFPGAVNCVDQDGNSLLHRAIYTGNLKSVSLLLSDPAIDLNFTDSEGRTPLSVACWKGLDQVALLLLSCDGIDADKADAEGMTPLLYATFKGRKKIVNALLTKPDVDPNKSAVSGVSPLVYAIQSKELSMFTCLISSPMLDLQRPFSNQMTPASMIGVVGSVEMLELLLQRVMIDQQVQQRMIASALFGACTNSQIALADLLLRKYRCSANSNENRFHSPALCVAANIGNPEMVSLLLRHGANPTASMPNGETVLQSAMKGQSADVVQLLLKHPGLDIAHPTQQITKTVAFALRSGMTKIVDLLLAALKEKNCLSPSDQLELIKAAIGSGKPGILSQVMSAFAIEVNHALPDDATLISLVCGGGNSELAAWLLKQGADSNQRIMGAIFPLECVAFNTDLSAGQIVIELMKSGADIDLIPTHHARSKAARKLGGLLLQALVPALVTSVSGVTRANDHSALATSDDLFTASQTLFMSMKDLSLGQQSVLMAGVLLDSVSLFDTCLADHPWLMKLLQLEYLSEPKLKKELLKLVHEKIKLWDGQGFDGAGRGSFSVLKTDRGRLPQLTREILQIWTGFAPEVFSGKS